MGAPPRAAAASGRDARQRVLRLPQERWLDFRQLDALKLMLHARIRMCAAKGFDAVELDDIDSFDPPSTTGFHLTPGDAQNFLGHAMNAIRRSGMTVLWKNSPLPAGGAALLRRRGRRGVLHVWPVLLGRRRREHAVRLHLYDAGRPAAVRLGRLHHRHDTPAADREVGRRGRVRRGRLRLRSGRRLYRPASVLGLLQGDRVATVRVQRRCAWTST